MSGASHGRHKAAPHVGEDRRRAPRLPPSALPPCKARLVGGPEVEIVNVSRTGILTRSGARLMPGSAIGIRFITADTVFVLMGRVVRSRLVALRDGQPQYESALAFDKHLPLLNEDPVAPESLEALRYVARHVNIPIAFGERCYSLYQFKELLDTGAVAMIRPDLSLAGGFTQVKKIAALAEAAFVGIFPHLMGSPVNLAAYVQLDAAIPNYALMESGSDALNEIVAEPLEREGGYVIVPDRPGIGVELREDRLSKFPYRPFPIRPARRADGAVAH
ncbi:MAG: hypothetical protein K6T92_09830 [Candidatus Rokubacteria bacterium]|nr:hypothetical protein [Candidatus Rokubacteria bacterium]